MGKKQGVSKIQKRNCGLNTWSILRKRAVCSGGFVDTCWVSCKAVYIGRDYFFSLNYMIKLVKKGKYSLVETRNDVKILKLDKKTFVWIFTKPIGEMLVTTYRPHKTDQKLAKGEYRIYKVVDEPKLVDQLHLELSIGEDDWQGYLLPTGFPQDLPGRKQTTKTKCRIIPTQEIVFK